jgi:AcrR family transcriptional regulator
MRQTGTNRKTQIVEAALGLIARNGPEQVPVEAIAGAVGLSQPGVFRHFPAKRQLWSAVADEVERRMVDAWDAAAEGPAGPLERLERLLAAQLDTIETTPALASALFSSGAQDWVAALRARLAQRMGDFLARLAALTEAAQRHGALRPVPSSADAALLLAGVVQACALRWSLTDRGFPLSAEGRRLVAAQLALMTPEPAP